MTQYPPTSQDLEWGFCYGFTTKQNCLLAWFQIWKKKAKLWPLPTRAAASVLAVSLGRQAIGNVFGSTTLGGCWYNSSSHTIDIFQGRARTCAWILDTYRCWKCNIHIRWFEVRPEKLNAEVKQPPGTCWLYCQIIKDSMALMLCLWIVSLHFQTEASHLGTRRG